MKSRAAIAFMIMTTWILGAPYVASAQRANYDQPYRPQVHFSPERNWTNDPNGLVLYHGEYHLFFQYNPFGDTWGHMSWGHAVSRDLLHWRQLPLAIPEENGVMIFTGSVVIDHNNTSGLCHPAKECLISIYTGDGETPEGHRQTQNLAYSLDDGRTWKKYEKNPVLDLRLADFRDPSVSWDERHNRWVMVVSLPQEHKVSFYHSSDLKQWVHASDFGPAGDTNGVWECPDLLRVPSKGKDGSMWALKVGLNPGAPQGGSGEQYFLGDFDGTTFTLSQEAGAHGWTNYGKDDYCAISFNGIPSGNPPVLIGWMNNWEYASKLPTAPWRGQMSLARKLTLVRDQGGFTLAQDPVIDPLRRSVVPLAPSLSSADHDAGTAILPPYELDFESASSSTKNFGVRIYSDDQHWTEIGFDIAKGELYIDRTRSGETSIPGFGTKTTAPVTPGRPYNAKVIVDRSSVEVFAQNGTIAMTNLIYPPSAGNRIVFFPSDPETMKPHAQLRRLASIWADADQENHRRNQ